MSAEIANAMRGQLIGKRARNTDREHVLLRQLAGAGNEFGIEVRPEGFSSNWTLHADTLRLVPPAEQMKRLLRFVGVRIVIRRAAHIDAESGVFPGRCWPNQVDP